MSSVLLRPMIVSARALMLLCLSSGGDWLPVRFSAGPVQSHHCRKPALTAHRSVGIARGLAVQHWELDATSEQGQKRYLWPAVAHGHRPGPVGHSGDPGGPLADPTFRPLGLDHVDRRGRAAGRGDPPLQQGPLRGCHLPAPVGQPSAVKAPKIQALPGCPRHNRGRCRGEQAADPVHMGDDGRVAASGRLPVPAAKPADTRPTAPGAQKDPSQQTRHDWGIIRGMRIDFVVLKHLDQRK